MHSSLTASQAIRHSFIICVHACMCESNACMCENAWRVAWSQVITPHKVAPGVSLRLSDIMESFFLVKNVDMGNLAAL